MAVSLPRWLRAPLALLLLVLNTLIHTLPLFVVALAKWLLPLPAWRRAGSRSLTAIAESWIGVNSALISAFTPTRWHIEGDLSPAPADSCLVIANHQSWVDIPVLQKVFNRRLPFMRFFLKRQLIWVPVLGLAWWALDFPFMHRHSREQLARRPQLRGRDREATRRACARYSGLPVAVMNFVEGTRLTAAKQAAQGGGFRHLLKPRAGGVAFALDAMAGALRQLVDVTIAYPGGRPGMRDLLAGRIAEIRVHVRRLAIPPLLLQGDYDADPAFRARFQDWLNHLWHDKDARMAQLLADAQA